MDEHAPPRAESGNGEVIGEARRLSGVARALRETPARVSDHPLDRRTRVLLVDDYEPARAALGMLLTVWGYEVAHAGSASEALIVAREVNPNVAVIDVRLPDGDGAALATRLCEWVPTLRACIALTGSSDPADHVRARAAGCAAVLTKPCDAQDLERVLAECGGRLESTPDARIADRRGGGVTRLALRIVRPLAISRTAGRVSMPAERLP